MRARLLDTSIRTICTLVVLLQGSAATAACQPRPVQLIRIVQADAAAITPENGFSGVVGAALLADGSFVVADAGRYSLHLFDASGKLQRSIGRKGKGPGEFTDLLWVDRCVDGSLVAFDGAPNRLEVFEKGGAFTQSIRLPPWLHFDAFLSCGSLTQYVMLLDRPRTMPPKGITTRFPAAVATVDLSKSRADTLVTLTGTDFFFAEKTPIYTELPLGQRALASSRAGVVAAGVSTIGAVLVFRAGRRTADTIELRAPKRSVSTADWVRAKEEQIEREPDVRLKKMITAGLAEAVAPKVMPVYDALLVDARGDVWTRAPASVGVEVWTRAGTTASDRRAFSLPKGSLILSTDSLRLLVLNRDEDGLEHVSVYRLPPR